MSRFVTTIDNVDYFEGDPVLVLAKSFYREKRIGVVANLCRDHDGAIRVLPLDPNASIKEVCIDTSKGDTIERLSTQNNP